MAFAHPEHRLRCRNGSGVRPLSGFYTERDVAGHPRPIIASPHGRAKLSSRPAHHSLAQQTPVVYPTSSTPNPPYGVMQRSSVERQVPH